jgi:endonuclease G
MRQTFLAIAIAMAAIGVATPALADTCPSFYFQGTAPRVGASAAPDQKIFCHTFYAVNYSTTLKDPLWSAEYLTAARAIGGDKTQRVKRPFGPQVGLDPNLEGRHEDFTNEGVDRGHMTPANDAADIPEQEDTFVVTNIVPQAKMLNEHLWAYLEASVHELAEENGEVFVVTGPVFDGAPKWMKGRIAIPTATYKAVYVPKTGQFSVFIASNVDATVCKVTSIAALIKRTGVDPFPSLPPTLKSASATLVLPHGVVVKSDGSHQPVPLPKCS